MMCVMIGVKYGKEMYDVDVDFDESGVMFKVWLCLLMKVLIECIKVMGLKGG